MTNLNRGAALAVALFLALLMAATRSHHFASLSDLPDASWAVFFLAGVYIRTRGFFPILLAEAVLLDFSAVIGGGSSGLCISPAYSLLLPAYGALWLGGQWYARNHRDTLSSITRSGAAMVTGGFLCELLSSGGYYFLSGHFDDPTLAVFMDRLLRYFPADLTALAGYVAVAALLHLLLRRSLDGFTPYGETHDERH